MVQVIVGFLVSFLIAMLLVRYAHLHQRFSGDNDLNGVQKFHTVCVPRVGGVAIMLGLLFSGLVIWWRGLPHSREFYLLLLMVLPAFFSGLYEDISKNGGVLRRLLCIMISAVLAWYFLGGAVNRLDFPWLDTWMAVPLVSLIFTVAAVTGLTNAMNLIDGYNGLAGAVSAIMLAGIAYVAFFQGDILVWSLAVSAIGAILGFLFWNWPRGMIFLGDGGAYLLGFLIAELVILLVARNPLVSPWFAALIVSYPMMEMGFTVLRRTARHANPGMPDAAHLHQLIYKRMIRWAAGSSRSEDRLLRNSMTSPYLWGLSSIGVVPAVLFWDNSLALQVSAFLFVVLYIWLYRSIITFRVPRWLLIRKRSG